MQEINIGIVGGGYMGKAHAVAYAAVGAAFGTFLRPKLEIVAASRQETAEQYRKQYGFARATANWQELVNDDHVEAVIVTTPSETHKEIVLAALKAGKHVFCEKPLGASLTDGAAMVACAQERPNLANMVGFNYIRTPAAQQIRKLLKAKKIGDITYFRGEMHEDFLAPEDAWNWRCEGNSNGALGDLAPHALNMALALMGPVKRLSAEMETLFPERLYQQEIRPVTNDDRGQCMCTFESGAKGHLSFHRAALGRKMGYAYEIFGTKGSIRFDQEDQNAFWLYEHGAEMAEMGFKKVLTNPTHPDYVHFNLGPGHGTGYQDQIIIEARDFLQAIETGKPVWPTFVDGQECNRIAEAIRQSAKSEKWVNLSDI